MKIKLQNVRRVCISAEVEILENFPLYSAPIPAAGSISYTDMRESYDYQTVSVDDNSERRSQFALVNQVALFSVLLETNTTRSSFSLCSSLTPTTVYKHIIVTCKLEHVR